MKLSYSRWLVCFVYLAFAMSWAFSVWFQLNRERQQLLISTISQASQIEKMYSSMVIEENRLLQGLVKGINSDIAIGNAWREQDREKLLSLALPKFNELKKSFLVSHLYFIDLQQICFLRVHAPLRHGDLIQRYTLEKSIQTNKDFGGLELGYFGHFILRHVHPWYYQGELIGYIELGVEIQHLTAKLKQLTDADMIFLINKSHLDRERANQGKHLLGQTINWEQYLHEVVVEGSSKSSAVEINHYISSSGKYTDHIFTEVFEIESQFVGANIRLKDTSGADLGRMLILTDQKIWYQNRTKFLIVQVIVLGFGGFWWVFILFIFKIQQDQQRPSIKRNGVSVCY